MQGGKGKLAVLGSCHMFSDQYIDKEENGKILVRYNTLWSLLLFVELGTFDHIASVLLDLFALSADLITYMYTKSLSTYRTNAAAVNQFRH